MTQRDIRETPLYKEIEERFRNALEPAFGKISSAMGPSVSPDGRTVAFTGGKLEKLEGTPAMRICAVDLQGGPIREVTGGPNHDRLPQWSPDGRHLAFLSDRKEKDSFQLFLLDTGRVGEATPAPAADGSVEYISWAPDGSAILLGVVERGADQPAVHGSGGDQSEKDLPSWMPSVDGGPDTLPWRYLALYDLESGEVRRLSREKLNVWEAAWAGPAQIAAIVSENPSEEAWYSAPLALIERASGQERITYRSEWQLGLPASSPDGAWVAVVEAVCSDRGAVMGDLLLVDVHDGTVQRVDTCGVDISETIWRDEERLLLAGMRGLESAVLEYDAAARQTREIWTTRDGSISFSFAGSTVSPVPGDGVVLIREGYDRYPEMVRVEDGKAHLVASLSHPGAEYLKSIGGSIREISWKAPDGLAIQSLLIEPDRPAPHPLILQIHGGPVGAVRDGFGSLTMARYLASFGYAVLLPNVRGSAGRGQEFARMVYGDLGGGETQDHLAGIDMLVAAGIADPKRIGVTGGSHGGFMAAWIITQTDRFAAAVPAFPYTNNLSFLGTSNIGVFARLFLQDEHTNTGGRFLDRSPVMLARNVRTPTLTIAGARDRCCPPTQAAEFHHALVEHGVTSELAIYPEEGHGIRTLPAQIDYFTRIIDWFQHYVPVGEGAEQKEAVPAAHP